MLHIIGFKLITAHLVLCKVWDNTFSLYLCIMTAAAVHGIEYLTLITYMSKLNPVCFIHRCGKNIAYFLLCFTL